MNLKQELEARSLFYQCTDEKLFEIYERGGEKFYCGYDPTADSLHLGHFLTLMTAVNFMKRGNTFVLLVGGATGFIGDPSGKDSSRSFLDEHQLRHNQEGITKQVKQLLENLKKITGQDFQFEVVNNYDFYAQMNVFDFFAHVGKYITVNTMLSKDSIKKRITDPNLSITYTEFSYMLLQGYDFLHLFEDERVKLQIGGSDQWGNIVTGTEMIRKKLGNETEVYAMTIPLMMDSTGKKFGKSEGNSVRLDPNKNSPYFVYQFLMNTHDSDVEKYLKAFTLLSIEKVDAIVAQHQQQPELRYGQQQLANYLIEIIFGEVAVQQAQNITEILFGSEDKMQIIAQMSKGDLEALAKETGSVKFEGEERRILELLVESGLAPSNGEAKKLIQSGSIVLNEIKVGNVTQVLKKSDLINGVALLRKGKKSYKLILS
ncbi:MAG: tyrosine--tRNA ligase [Candidatus Absconditabacteria bacterium]|nr:tyrosine--tRNA ligase [Candidatus Absconditabacteria bacterium]MDD3868375.1 tyrosine--tRNA ligase [Candidatus Absconditabacteria bacterium]MDD4714456.1 tyrosine--tRNA ligase [Candidatus Absconditabacteria bacterium]